MSSLVLSDTKNNIRILTLNRPEQLNALNTKLLGELREEMTRFLNDDEVYGCIITGSGEKAFAAGADIKEFTGFNSEQARALSQNGHEIFNMIENSSKPVIAAVNGFALGGGCELAMSCHLRVGSENAKFGQPEVNLGIIPGYGGTQRLAQYIGKGRALEFLMTGDMIDARDALSLGLINHIATRNELMNKCEEILNKIFQKSPHAIAKVIEAQNAYYDSNKDGMKTEISLFGECCSHPEFSEGTDAFLSKRKPNFRTVSTES